MLGDVLKRIGISVFGGKCPVAHNSDKLELAEFPQIAELNADIEEQAITLFLPDDFDRSLLPVKADSSRAWWEEDNKAKNHARFCLPLTMASSLGYYILSPATFTVEWDGDETHDTKVTILDAASHAQVDNHSTHGGFTIQARFVVRTKNPGDFVYVKGIANQYRLPYTFLEAMIEAWWTPADFGLVAMLNQAGKFTIHKGEPVAQMFVVNSSQAQYGLTTRNKRPPKRDEWDLSANARIESGTGKNFHYMRGLWPDQTSVSPHFKSWSKENTQHISTPTNTSGTNIDAQQLLEFGQNNRYTQPQQAEDALKKAIAIVERQSDDKLLLANCYCGLALVYDDRRYYRESAKLLKNASDIREKILGREDPETLTALNWLACIMSHGGRNKEAEKLFREVIQLRKKVLGKTHPDVAYSLADVGFLYKIQDNYVEARKYFMQAIECSELYAKDDIQLALLIEYLAFLYREHNYLEKAEEAFEKVYAVRKRSLAEGHKDLIKTIVDLAFIDRELNSDKEAEENFVQAVSLAERFGHEEPLYLAQQLEFLGFFYKDLGIMDKASAIFGRILDLKEKALPDKSPQLLETARTLLDCYVGSGNESQIDSLRQKYNL